MADWLERSAPRESPQVHIADRYKIIGLLGTGGMGQVYLVEDVELDERVALKILREELSANATVIGHFRREVKLARRVTHPNVVRTYDLGSHGGRKYLTMEAIQGQSLSAMLALEGRLPTSRALPIARQICAGLSAAHRAGVVHRDLKPDNVLLGPLGRVCISDFGIAKAQAAGVNFVAGTPGYMAPEAYAGEGDVRSDLFSLGALMFEMLTGSRPYTTAAPPTAPPPDASLRFLSLTLSETLTRLLDPDPEARFTSAEEVDQRLAECTLTPGTRPRPKVTSPLRTAPSLAVLPFDHPDGQESVSIGLTEELVHALSRTPGLSVQRAWGGKGTAAEQGQALGVDATVHGAVQVVDGNVRWVLRLTSAGDGYTIAHLKRSGSSWLELVDEVASLIAHHMAVDLNQPKRPTASPQATVQYLEAKAVLRKGWQGDLNRALQMLREANEQSPNHPSILATLASALSRKAFTDPANTAKWLAQAEAAANQALVKGDEQGEPWCALADIAFYRSDPSLAVQFAAKALARNPGLARAHEIMGMLQLECGSLEAAERRFQTSTRLDPASLTITADHARLFSYKGDFEGAQTLLAGTGEPHLLARLRLLLWSGLPLPELASFLPLPSGFRTTEFAELAPLLLSGAFDESELPTRVRASLDEAIGRQSWVRRQFLIEAIIATTHSTKLPRILLREAVSCGLADLRWFDDCPVLQPLRSDPDWASWRQPVAERAAATRQALAEVP